MDPDMRLRYEGVVNALSDAEHRQVARDIRHDHMKALGDNATLTALNTRLRQDLESERLERAEDIARLSDKQQAIVADLTQQLGRGQSERRSEALSTQLGACRQALQLQNTRVAELEEALANLRNAEHQRAKMLHEERPLARSGEISSQAARSGDATEEESTGTTAQGAPSVSSTPDDFVDDGATPPAWDGPSALNDQLEDDDPVGDFGGASDDDARHSPSATPGPAPTASSQRKRRAKATTDVAGSSTRTSARLSAATRHSATPSSAPSSTNQRKSRRNKRRADWDEAGEVDLHPEKRQKSTDLSSASVASMFAAYPSGTANSDKISIRCFVDDDTLTTIWDKHCKVDLDPFKHCSDDTEIVYEIGDIILFRNDWYDMRGPADILETSKQFPLVWTGILCNYSSGNPYEQTEDGIVALPVHSEDEPITSIAVMWLFSQNDITKTLDKTVKHHQYLDIVDETNLRATFFGGNVPEKQRFFSSELEWMNVGDLCGHLNPRDIGCAPDSGRAVIVDWSGPVLEHREEMRRPKGARKSQLTHIYTLKQGTGLGDDDFPDGWIHE
ncbi:unnamed protein product [Peniophora sp. CBMAI 1063]|nr:unnamed protein product [Peniophora sp. CBMAI 1063]